MGVVVKRGRKVGFVIAERLRSRRGRGLSVRQEGIKERIIGIVLDVELDADLLEVTLDDRFNVDALGEAYLRRVLELQALPVLGSYPIRTSHPAIIIEQFIGCS